MFYFSKLVKDEHFVGLRVRQEQVELCLPKGFEDFDAKNFDELKKVFFLFYRLFRKYAAHLNKKEHTFTSSEDEELRFFANFDALDAILNAYDESMIWDLQKKAYKTTEIDFNKIHLYLHKAVYIDDFIFLDEMNKERHVLVQEYPPISTLFCYIFVQIKQELQQQEELSFQVLDIAQYFKENFVDFLDLFDENFEQNIESLRVIFEEIHQKSNYKDDSYWHFYEAIHQFLYFRVSQDACIWGISKFYPIWEHLCLAYCEEKYENSKVLADKRGELYFYKKLSQEELSHPFQLSIKNHHKFLRPDFAYQESYYVDNIEKLYQIVVEDVIEKRRSKYTNKDVRFREKILTKYPKVKEIYKKYYRGVQENRGNYESIWEADFKKFEMDLIDYGKKNIKFDSFVLIDFKYHSPEELAKKSEKIAKDVRKQLLYEWTVQENMKIGAVSSVFFVPCYVPDSQEIELGFLDFSQDYGVEHGIRILKINLLALIKKYL